MKHHFISGLPRSGSTLLSALLRQNPRIHADVSSPLARLYASLLLGMSGEVELGHHLTDGQRHRLLRGLFDGFYADHRDKALVFDTSRQWCARTAGLRALFGEVRIVCCVRSPAWVVDSLEQLVHRQPHRLSALFGYAAEDTLSARVDGVTSLQGMVGSALDALRQAVHGHDRDTLLLLRYETLVSDPARALAEIYQFLGEPAFDHDFDHVHHDANVMDLRLQTPGLHTLRPRVALEPRRSILPPDMFAQLDALSFWEDPVLREQGLRVH
jgi:sulfotransferase